MALHSTNFCVSAINAFILVLKNSGTFFITEGLSTIFTFLGKITISVVNTSVAYLTIYFWQDIKTRINSPIGPLIAVFLVSYIIATIFMTVFGITSNSLLQCFLTDVELSRAKGHDDFGKHRPKELEELVTKLKKN